MKKIQISSIIIILVISCAIYAAGPLVIYGPDVLIMHEDKRTHIPAEDFIGVSLFDGDIVKSNSSIAYILFNDNQLIELSSYTTLCFNEYPYVIQLDSGVVTIHFRNTPDTSSFILLADSTRVRYPSADSSWICMGDSTMLFIQGSLITKGSYKVELTDWFEVSSMDADYMFKLIDKSKIPDAGFRFRFPSKRPPPYKYRVRGQGGIANYEGQEYYYGGWLYRVDFYYLRLAYNLWFGMSSNGRFYNEAWDEWMDLIDHIHYIELFTPQDPAYFRIGLIENLFFGHGMLVNNYNNAVFLPFEKKNGLQMTFNLNSTKTVVFTNNIANPRVFGLYFGWQADKRFYTDFTFIGDVDQFNDIEDTDGDSYPDEIDPQPDVYNYSQDSVLTGFPVQSLDDYDSRGIYGAALGMKYKFLRGRHFSGVMSGEMAGLSNKSMGVTFPNLGLNIRWFSLSAGLDFQTPHFSDGIFDRSYEKDKARFIDNGEGSLELVTRANQLEEAEGWLYGWNNSFSVQIPKYFRIRTSFRDIYRDNDRDKKFALSLDIDYPIFKYVTRTSFFIEQKNVSYLFQKKTDGESCGLGFRIKPHNTITINIRYRERYTDSDANGVIEKDETERNFDGNAIIDGNYWWKKFLEWRRKKKAEKELNTPSSKAAIF